MSYVVLARKYRPNQFDEVVGQGHVARTLKNAIEQDRVAHAFLFAGARGVGKTSTARILAKALNCKTGPTPTPCGECVACVEIKEGQSLDVFEIDGASNRGINEIRELRESVRYAPSRDTHKIYIIDEVHMLTTEAFNALLKTLEEPPPHAKFIFATTEPQKIPVTILSRCQRYDFKRVGLADIVAHLERVSKAESVEIEKGALQIIARQAAGGMRDALSLLDQIISFSEAAITEAHVSEVLGVANRKQLFALSESVVARDAEAVLRILDDVNRYGYDLGVFAAEFVSHLRDLAVIKVVDDPTGVTDLTESEVAMARGQISDVPVNLLHRYFSVMAEATQELSRSSFPKLIFEMTLVRLTRLEPLIGTDLLIDRLKALEAELDDVADDPRGPENPDLRQPAPRREEEPLRAPVRSSPPEASPPEVDEPASVVEVDDVPEEIETAVNTAELERLTPQARWKKVVEALGEENRPLAMTAEHAWVERFDDGVVEIAFAAKYFEIVAEPGRVETLQLTVQRLFGAPWRVKLVAPVTEEVPRMKTLADERDDEIQRRVKLIEDELRNHHVVREARDLFDVAEDTVRVQVKLFDDE